MAFADPLPLDPAKSFDKHPIRDLPLERPQLSSAQSFTPSRDGMAGLLLLGGPAMPRSLRYVPEGGSLVEVTTRTIQSRLLLTPKPLLNHIILGALARASRLYEVGIVAHCFVSNTTT